MICLTGEYESKMDAKGRLAIPAKLKAALPKGSDQNTLVLSRGFDPCLILYPMVEWKKVYSRVIGLNEFNEEFRAFQRNFFRGNTEVELDANGRFLIPKTMALYAGLEKETVLVGMGSRMELWNPERYNEYLIQDNQEFARLAQKYLSEDAN